MTKFMRLKSYWLLGFLGFLGLLGINNPPFYAFFVFFLFFLEPLVKFKNNDMGSERKGSKAMFSVGIILIVATAILLLGNFMGESTFPMILGMMGIIFIGASNFRLLK
jgi:hypothetical protein